MGGNQDDVNAPKTEHSPPRFLNCLCFRCHAAISNEVGRQLPLEDSVDLPSNSCPMTLTSYLTPWILGDVHHSLGTNVIQSIDEGTPYSTCRNCSTTTILLIDCDGEEIIHAPIQWVCSGYPLSQIRVIGVSMGSSP